MYELNENERRCKAIADELDAIAGGRVHVCPACGETVAFPDGVGDKFKCPHCEDVSDVDDWEEFTLYDYLSDVFDIEFRVESRHDETPRSVRVMVACGGPNIYIDTGSGDVVLHWWTDSARWGMSSAAIDAVDAWAADVWGC